MLQVPHKVTSSNADGEIVLVKESPAVKLDDGSPLPHPQGATATPPSPAIPDGRSSMLFK
jgi:hypothetical protein